MQSQSSIAAPGAESQLENTLSDWKQSFNRLIDEIPTSVSQSIQSTKDILQRLDLLLDYQFQNQVDITELLSARTHFMDELLVYLWRDMHPGSNPQATIIAVGGYGRGEMHPCSDVDLLILLPHDPAHNCESFLSDFITRLWDISLDLGHSVRTLPECLKEAGSDLTVITNLIESRFLCGDESLYQQLLDDISTQNMWSDQAFFLGKLEEQARRYDRFGDTAYRVEPNLKDGPGGLRDIHMLGWIMRRHFGTLSLEELRDRKLISEDEYATLINSRNFLWRVRFALHLIAKRKEDRLLLDFQRQLANMFGHNNNANNNQDVEDFMQRYYRTITTMERFNEMLVAILRENIMERPDEPYQPIGDHYYQHGHELGINTVDTFRKHPHTLLEIFYILQTRSGIENLTPQTIRQIQNDLDMIDDAYRDEEKHKHIFIKIISESSYITFVLRRMNRYGVLAAWIPVFANIVGRMQFDLFHAYTVDEHTLKVISNIRRNSIDKGKKDFPYESRIFDSLSDHKVLYLAGLFHDIAKGRNGDHSSLGAIDAFQFCRAHGVNSFKSNLVSWLVRYHLLMSTTAQRKDISDPVVIHDFANQIVDPSRLDYLYLLTLADIHATNPELLTSWKYSLIRELYDKTRKLLLYGMPPASYEELVQQTIDAVIEKLPAEGIDVEQGRLFCQEVGYEYLVQNSVSIILWHLSSIEHAKQEPVIKIRPEPMNTSSQLFVYARHKQGLITRILSTMEKLNLNIVAANINSIENGYSLCTFNFLNRDNSAVMDEHEEKTIIDTMDRYLSVDSYSANMGRIDGFYITPRRLKYFDVATSVKFAQDYDRNHTVLTINTGDRPGLLSLLSEVFYDQNIRIVNARISTLGEVAEDIFRLVTYNDEPIIDEVHQDQLKKAIMSVLD